MEVKNKKSFNNLVRDLTEEIIEEDQDEKDNHFRSQRCVFALSTQVFFPIGGKGKESP